MAKKKKSWFSLVKRIFVSESQSVQDKKERRKRWVFGGFKVKKLPSLPAPPRSPQTRPSEAEDEQNKPIFTVAAAEVVKVTEESSSSASSSTNISIEESAATRIQTAFRGYLARKALQALKGIVKLQALIRGQAVRRQSVTTLERLRSVMNIQTQACARRFHTTDENTQWQVLEDEMIKMDPSSENRWDDSTLSKNNAQALMLSKKEAAIKRKRMKEYSFLHRKSAESERNNVNGRLRYWLEQWVDTQVSKSRELEDLDTIRSTRRYSEEFGGRQRLELRHFQRTNPIEGLDMDCPVLGATTSSHYTRIGSKGQDQSSPSSPVAIPTYMAATQSARAKARSVSTPKQRLHDTFSDCHSPYKNKLSHVSSSRPGGGYYRQRSPSLKAVPGLVKSSKLGKDLSFDSECSFPNWDLQFR